jgi:IS30 family transposase
MPKGNPHLTLEQRCQISALNKRGVLQQDIAHDIGVSKSTISRELKRHKNKDGTYNYKVAQMRSRQNKAINRTNPQKLTYELRTKIYKLLKANWSPDQLTGRLRFECKIDISCHAIYKFIAKDKKQGGKLYHYLRHKGKKYRDYNPKKASKSLIPNRVDISQRPNEVEKKAEIGHWEGDTIVGKGKRSGLITLTERHSKLTRVIKVTNFKAENVADKICDLLADCQEKVLSITFDNGLEFASHARITERIPHVKIYFAKPYRSWQRGLNEHTNGLIREYYPKGTDFNAVSDVKIRVLQNKLNLRPRKVLNYKAPEEVFFRIKLNCCSIAFDC